MITLDQFKKCFPYASQKNIAKFYDPLCQTMTKFDINTMRRISQFLAQLEHESGSLQYVKELADGSAYETGALARMLGNTHPGDGPKYKGRGLIQITGRGNYQAMSVALGKDLINNPELLEQPMNASMSAGWFWKKHGLNELADVDNYVTITRRINGGLNGWAERLKFWMLNEQVLGVEPYKAPATTAVHS